MSKNGKKKKYVCPECYKEYVPHPDVLCEKCQRLYVDKKGEKDAQ